MDWFEAQAYCNNLYANAYLAEIKSAKTQQLLADHANSIMDHNWWLGGADFFKEGQWRWERKGDAVDFSAWAENQPNNGNHNGITEDCVHMFNTKQSPERRWNDHVCQRTGDEHGAHPLCQRFY